MKINSSMRRKAVLFITVLMTLVASVIGTLIYRTMDRHLTHETAIYMNALAKEEASSLNIRL